MAPIIIATGRNSSLDMLRLAPVPNPRLCVYSMRQRTHFEVQNSGFSHFQRTRKPPFDGAQERNCLIAFANSHGLNYSKSAPVLLTVWRRPCAHTLWAILIAYAGYCTVVLCAIQDAFSLKNCLKLKLTDSGRQVQGRKSVISLCNLAQNALPGAALMQNCAIQKAWRTASTNSYPKIDKTKPSGALFSISKVLFCSCKLFHSLLPKVRNTSKLPVLALHLVNTLENV